MNGSIRVSPVQTRLEMLGAQFAERNAIAVALRVGEQDSVRAQVAGLADFSFLRKTGCKGSGAADWLNGHTGELPARNSWLHTSDGSTVARLGDSEFFIEDGPQSALCAGIAEALRQPVDDVCPVYRNDASFALTGNRANELLLEVCSFNFRELQLGSVVMAMMAGVSVLVLRRDAGTRGCYRIWCDPTMAGYLWDTLSEIALELGGGPIGVDALSSAQASM